MNIKHIHILFIVVIIIGGGIWLTSEVGLFDTTRSVEPARLTEEVYDIADIRGSFTLSEVETYYQVPPAAMIETFNLNKDTNPTSFQLKDLKEIYQPVEIEGEMVEVETDTVKVFVSLYSDIPYRSEETTHLPEQVVDYLMQENKLTEEEQDYWKNHTFDLIPIEQDTVSQAIEEEENEEIQPVIEEKETESLAITGRTTIAELLSMGIEAENFQEITGLELPEDRSMSIRDYTSSQGLEFSVIREKLESMLVSGS